MAARRPRSVPYGRLTAILLSGAVLRLAGLVFLSPPGPSHDEVANWLIDRTILDQGNYAVYYPAAYGHEAGFHYVQAAFVALLGDHLLALRLPAAFAGLLGVAVVYALARRLWGRHPALWAAALATGLFYPIFFSRQGLRAISLPLVAGLAAYAWWWAWAAPLRGSAWRRFGVAGLLAGLSLYTYSAARVVPIFFAVYIVYLAIFHRAKLARRRSGLLLFGVVMTAVALPLAAYLWANPAAEFRVAEVSGPWRALQAGEWGPVVANVGRLVAGFGWAGDPLWRHNIAGQPIFSPIWAALFYAGVLLSAYRMRDSRYAFALLWLLTSLIPSALTIDAPSTIRISNTLVVLSHFPAIVIHNFTRLSPFKHWLSTDIGRIVGIVLVAILYSWVIGGTIRDTFQIWPRHPEVQFVWQAALTEIAGHVERQEPARATAVGGWTPETMDAPTLALLRDRPTTPLRHFNPATALVLPPGPGAIWYPTALPPAPPLRAVLAELGEPSVQTTLITGFLYEERDLASPSTPVSARFGEEVQLLGFDAGPACRPWTATFERPCTVVTYWRILTPPAGPRRLYLHLLGAGPAPLAQDDRLDAPAAWWQAGDMVLQLLSLPAPVPETAYTLRLGVYDPLTGQRLPTADGADGIVLWADAGGE